MALPRFTRTLHFRISGIFMLMLALVAGGFYFWLNATLFQPSLDDAEADWYENRAESELDTLAGSLSGASENPVEMERLLVEFGKRVDRFSAEVIVFDAQGAQLTSSAPDSLIHTVNDIDPQLLSDMSSGTWDYSSYPVPDDMDAYENRIFEVDRIFVQDGADSTITAYLAASYRPMVVGIEELEGQERAIGFQAILLILVYAGLSGLIIMAWMSRRIGKLSRGMQEFTGGELARRVDDRSPDEIGTLSHHFNSMAQHIESMVGELQQKELFQRQLIANISHDLRTPMASMKGYAETLSMQGDKLRPEERDRYLHIISANLEHLDSLIDHMLTLSRFESGQTVFQMEDFPLAELADSVVLRCEPLAREKGISLDLDCDDSVPAIVHADPLQIAQVLQNLIENGIKFNRQGGSVTVRVKAENGAEQRVKLEVQDTGLGIAAEDLPHIFDRFYTADKSRRRATTPGMASVKQHLGQSSGLGLAIAAKIVAGHQGKLEAESQLGQGTTFSFSLAAAPQEKARQAEA